MAGLSGKILDDSLSISTYFAKYESTTEEVNNDKVWKGISKNNFLTITEEFSNTHENVIVNQLNKLSNADRLFEQYKLLKKTINELEQKYNAAKTEGNEEAATSYQSAIDETNEKIGNYKQKINSLLAEIIEAKMESSVSNIDYSQFNLDELISQGKTLRKLSEGENLNSFYSEGYVEQVLEEIKANHTGRDAAVLSALTLIKLAADKGVKLDYNYGGNHDGTVVTISDVLKGVDCSTFVSSMMNQGSSKEIKAMWTGSLEAAYSQYTVDYSEAKPGDIINSEKHVEMILENHPEEGYFITAEAKSSKEGIIISKTTYDECRNQNQAAYNLDEVYK